MEKQQGTVLITGATGGIGRSFAHHLAAQQHELLLTDVDPGKLEQMAAEFKSKYGTEVSTAAVNLLDEKQLTEFTKKIAAEGKVAMLVNCAGFGEGIPFNEEPLERQLKMIQVHITATVHLVHAVLPAMIERRNGTIITVASMAAFIPAPGSSIYAASKSFLNSFMESIHMEVHGYGIRVQSLCPGMTHTEFHDKLGKEGKRSGFSQAVPWMEADEVVDLSLKCLEAGKVVCIPGCLNKTVRKAIPIFPRKLFYSIVEKMSGKK